MTGHLHTSRYGTITLSTSGVLAKELVWNIQQHAPHVVLKLYLHYFGRLSLAVLAGTRQCAPLRNIPTDGC